MTATAPKITPLRVTWANLMASAGDRAPALRSSLMGLVLAAAVQGAALACLMPVMQGVLQRDWQAALPWLGAMALLAGIATLIRWRAQGFDYDGDMVQTTHDLRSLLGQQLRRIPLEELQDRRAGEINATLLGNVDENLSYVLTIAQQIASAVITPLVVALATLVVDWRMGVLLLLIFPLLVPFYRWRRPAFGRGMRALAAANETASADMLEYTQGLPVLRAANCAGAGAQRLQASVRKLEMLQTIGQRKGAKPNLVIASAMELGLLLVVALGAALVVHGGLDLAILAALAVIIVRFTEPLSNVILMTLVIDLMEAALGRIKALMEIAPLPQQQPETRPQSYDIAFHNVHFGYRDQKPTLVGLDVTLPARRMTALVGPSGSGKTTITRLIMRHADPQQGGITIGGVDLRSIPPEGQDALVSAVFQDVYLFDDTILANIRMARPDASDAQVHAAARAANCHDFITRFPEGYDTRVGDIGGRLSGGERQRISIARAMLKDAPIVILDEPTAALDTQSEVAVQSAIEQLVRDRTVIVIAHRLSTITAADHILVIDGGQIVEQGQHEDLIARNGRYARMWNKQQTYRNWHATN